jgi:hypothetical protein
MKISHILEGVRMGASDLRKAPKKEYTIGFEFEVGYIPTAHDPRAFKMRWIEDNRALKFENWITREKIIEGTALIDEMDLQPKYGYPKSDADVNIVRQNFPKSLPSEMLPHFDYVWTDSTHTKLKLIHRIRYSAIPDYFDTTLSDIFAFYAEEWIVLENKMIAREYKSFISQMPEHAIIDKAIEHIARKLKNTYGEDNVVTHNADHTKWSVVEDGTPRVAAEIVSPVMPYKQGLAVLDDIMSLINDDQALSTSEATGLHINIGTWTQSEINNVDWLKFMVLLNGSYIAKLFGRTKNSLLRDRMKSIKSGLLNSAANSHIDNDYSVNDYVIGLSEKKSLVNLSKLKEYGYIEIRAPGNTGYETKGEIIKQQISRIFRALDAASDPMKFRKEYLKAFATLPGSYAHKTEISPAGEYFGNFNVGYTPETIATSLREIIKKVWLDRTDISLDASFNVNVYNSIRADINNLGFNGLAHVRNVIEATLKDIPSDFVREEIKNSNLIRLLLRAN